MVTAAQKIFKNSNHLYIRNVLHIKLVKLQSIWKSGSGRIAKNKSGTALASSCVEGSEVSLVSRDKTFQRVDLLGTD